MSIDFEFRKLVMDYHIGSEVIKYCYQCSRCTDNCPVSAVTIDFYSQGGYNPRANILNALLGYKDAIFSADKLAGRSEKDLPRGSSPTGRRNP